ncbi:MAG: RNA 2',3'-cyclic phosphodiesterase [Candidatus Eremiobacteraeota bacterium]|nr:RNA 2',3'-cyclic phosphodiesterase [Candidatus Eremiobacteraeota bacterium]
MRLFIAVALDDAARSACLAAQGALRAAGWERRLVAPANLHCTVAFVGSADDALLDPIVACMHDAATPTPPFALTLDTLGAFPHRNRPRVVWLGPARTPPAFARLCARIRSPLARLGFALDARADAHVTLARPDGRSALPAIVSPRSATLHVDALTLFSSSREHGATVYRPLAVSALRG